MVKEKFMKAMDNALNTSKAVTVLYDELKAKGMEADYDDILKNVPERDYIDSHREVSPLRQADDAILLDNSHMTIPEQKQWLMDQSLAKVNA